ncbi:MAG: inorganic phosphate transporter [Candidatus Moduliflexus flocculans]|nr:inorganic phosphate transporter [Candidatus Moduliflexus flocculans]
MLRPAVELLPRADRRLSSGAAIAKAGLGRHHRPRLVQDRCCSSSSPRCWAWSSASCSSRSATWIVQQGHADRGSTSWSRRLQLVSAALYSLGHGGNDAQKTMGIIAGADLCATG